MTWERTARQNSVRDEVKFALEAKNRARRYRIQGQTYMACGTFMAVWFVSWSLISFNLAWLLMSVLGMGYFLLGRWYMRVLAQRALTTYKSRMDGARSMARMWKSLDDLDGFFGSEIAKSMEQALKAIEEETE